MTITQTTTAREYLKETTCKLFGPMHTIIEDHDTVTCNINLHI